MPSSAATLRGAAPTEIVSPELVLVDPGIASQARDRLDEPEDTLARLEHQIWRSRLASLGTVADVEGTRSQSPRVRPPRPRTLPRKLVPAAAIAATLMIALLLGVNVDLRSTPAGADSTGSDGPTTATRPGEQGVPKTTRTPPRAKTPKGTSPRRQRAAGSAKSGPRRFAWAPVTNASGYRVEFFRGAVRIYSRATTDPQVALPEAWTFRGRKYRLVSGEYRWYVWPIVSGLRQSQATVQAQLVVP